MALADKYFIEEAAELLVNGFNDKDYPVRPKWPDGTPAHTIKMHCAVRRYDLSKEFPILTLRKQAFKTAVKEILWIWQKKSNNINDLGAHIWDEWADETGSIGKAYGYQLAEQFDFPEGKMNQVELLIKNLKENPMNRRMIVTLWNNSELKDMHLAPCCYETIWDVADGKLNCTLIQRSGDLLAAAASGGFNTIEYALLVHMLAQVCGYKVGTLVHIVNNLHIYDRHVEAVKEILQNEIYEAPSLWINPEVKNFEDFTADDFKLIEYSATKLEKTIEIAV